MRSFVRFNAVSLVAVVLLLGGCGNEPTAPESTPSPVAPGPSYPDVTTGDVETDAQLHAFDPAAESAVIEPTFFKTGPDFCAALHLASTDPRCERDWVTEDSHLKVTLPVRAGAKLLTMRAGDPQCLGSMELGGTCPLTPRQFAALLARQDEMLVHVSIRAGEITRIAEQYTP